MLVRQKVPARPVTCMGLTFKTRWVWRPGWIKWECIDALGAMGFGSIEIGTVTPRPQPGNDKPRIFRLVDAEGLINRMGFNNHGVDNPVENVKRRILTACWVSISAKIKIRRLSTGKMIT
nr:Dihydroorotate dehydrogenase (quinone) [Klebsiella pneumoniae]